MEKVILILLLFCQSLIGQDIDYKYEIIDINDVYFTVSTYGDSKLMAFELYDKPNHVYMSFEKITQCTNLPNPLIIIESNDYDFQLCEIHETSQFCERASNKLLIYEILLKHYCFEDAILLIKLMFDE